MRLAMVPGREPQPDQTRLDSNELIRHCHWNKEMPKGKNKKSKKVAEAEAVQGTQLHNSNRLIHSWH